MKHSVPTTSLTVAQLTEMARLKDQEAAIISDDARQRQLLYEANKLRAIVKERRDRLRKGARASRLLE